jgi:ubiquinone/menaquinone biosynthesis C-methylase UbiE
MSPLWFLSSAARGHDFRRLQDADLRSSDAWSAMKPTKQDVARQFDRMSHAYAESDGHARGDDLAMVVEFVSPASSMRVLDIATGAGHTALALAPKVHEVVAADIAPAMLQRTTELALARGITNVETVLMDAESLEFADASFDAVTCRIAPHHFLDVDRALSEVARVLRNAGAFVVEDSMVPEDPELDRFLNDLERVRDSTHVRSLTAAEWKIKLRRAGLEPRRETIFRKVQHVGDWIARAGISEQAASRVYAAFNAASREARQYFAIEFSADRATRFTDDKIIIRAEKRR